MTQEEFDRQVSPIVGKWMPMSVKPTIFDTKTREEENYAMEYDTFVFGYDGDYTYIHSIFYNGEWCDGYLKSLKEDFIPIAWIVLPKMDDWVKEEYHRLQDEEYKKNLEEEHFKEG